MEGGEPRRDVTLLYLLEVTARGRAGRGLTGDDAAAALAVLARVRLPPCVILQTSTSFKSDLHSKRRVLFYTTANSSNSSLQTDWKSKVCTTSALPPTRSPYQVQLRCCSFSNIKHAVVRQGHAQQMISYNGKIIDGTSSPITSLQNL